MKKKSFWIPLIVCICTISILYLIGYLFNIEFLQWFYFEETSSGFISGGSLNPIIIGFIMGFITERIYKNKQKDNSNLV